LVWLSLLELSLAETCARIFSPVNSTLSLFYPGTLFSFLRMLNNGASIIIVSRMLGYSKPGATLDIYSHLTLGKPGEEANVKLRQNHQLKAFHP